MSSPRPDRGDPRIAWKPFSPHASAWRERFWDPADTASVRVRCLAPCEALADAGWSSELFASDRAESYDVVIFQKAYDEGSVRLADELKRRGTRLVLDLCDNHFYNPDGRPELAARAERLQRMIDLADAISVSTPALAEVLPDTAAPVHVVDDALDPLLVDAFASPAPALARAEQIRVVWFGMQIPDLEEIAGELKLVSSESPLVLTVIGNSRRAARGFARRAGIPTRFRRWRPGSFVRDMAQSDVCVIPVANNPFTRVKTSNRVVTSLLLGTPVVASRLPSYEEFSSCILFEDWAESMARYAGDPDLAAAHVRTGRDLISTRYTRDHLTGQWSAVIDSALG